MLSASPSPPGKLTAAPCGRQASAIRPCPAELMSIGYMHRLSNQTNAQARLCFSQIGLPLLITRLARHMLRTS